MDTKAIEKGTPAAEAKSAAALEGFLSDGTIMAYPGICEPGYECGPKGVLLANWNPIDDTLKAWLRDQGYTLHWSDEWTMCSDCGNVYRSVSDSYAWKCYGYTDKEGEDHCGACVRKDPEEYLRSLEGSSHRAVTIDGVCPVEHGYLKINTQGLESGLHPGMDADPKQMARTLRAKGVTRFIFDITEPSQFYTTFDLYIHEDHAADVGSLRELLGFK